MARVVQSDVARLGGVLLRHARDAFGHASRIAAQWRELNFAAPPDPVRAAEEYDRFVALLEELGVEPFFAPPDDALSLDAIYVRDAAVLCDRGAILCRMGKASRRDEPAALEATFGRLGIPLLGAIGGEARLEGGDVAWLDRRTLAVGRGYRTDDAGIAQLRALLGDCADEVVVVPLPHAGGPGDVFHLMSMFSPVDDDLAVVHSPWMPVPFRETLLERGFELVEVPEEEYETMGCNVLAVGPRRCVMLAGNPRTRRRLERAGAEVAVYEGREISVKGAGGPTCLTRPLWRETGP